MSRRVRGSIAAGIILLACNSPTDGCGCPPTPVNAVVHGHVQLASGEPAVNATVSAYIAQADGCVARNFPDNLTMTASDGNYRLAVPSPIERDSVCVLIRVRPPSGSGITTVVDTAVQLAFRAVSPIDSAEVNATLGGP